MSCERSHEPTGQKFFGMDVVICDNVPPGGIAYSEEKFASLGEHPPITQSDLAAFVAKHGITPRVIDPPSAPPTYEELAAENVELRQQLAHHRRQGW